MEWSHTTLGTYDISDQWLGLDFRSLFLDPVRAQTTLAHEVTHSLISKTTDMGLAMQGITASIKKFKHLEDEDGEALYAMLRESQIFVQEGFATFMEMQLLRHLTSWDEVDNAKVYMHPDYLKRFEQMEFMFRESKKVRERFTKKISGLVMETGFRKEAPKQDLLRDPEKLKQFLSDNQRNPGKRLQLVLEQLEKGSRILRKKPRRIAKACKLDFFEPATRQEVADFANYIFILAGERPNFTTEMVGRADGQIALRETADNLLITNLNLNLDGGSFLWTAEDIEFEASFAQVAFVVLHTPLVYDDMVSKKLNRKLEIDLLMFGKNGEKYTTVTSLDHINTLFANQLASVTVMTKWGICDPATNTFRPSLSIRPHIVIYNRPRDMLTRFMESSSQIQKYEYVHIAAMEGHPFHTLLVMTNGSDTIHFVNGFGDRGIAEVINLTQDKGKELDLTNLRPYSRRLNDALASMGLPWDVNWTETMIDQKNIVRR